MVDGVAGFLIQSFAFFVVSFFAYKMGSRVLVDIRVSEEETRATYVRIRKLKEREKHVDLQRRELQRIRELPCTTRQQVVDQIEQLFAMDPSVLTLREDEISQWFPEVAKDEKPLSIRDRVVLRCPSCGATTDGKVCDYCGSKLN